MSYKLGNNFASFKICSICILFQLLLSTRCTSLTNFIIIISQIKCNRQVSLVHNINIFINLLILPMHTSYYAIFVTKTNNILIYILYYGNINIFTEFTRNFIQQMYGIGIRVVN